MNSYIRAALMPRMTKYIPHIPHPKQQAFMLLTGREALFGGAAGGGKSDALLMSALQYVDIPGYAALILRRTYSDLALPDAIMSRAHEWLSPWGIHWNDDEKTFTFPEGGKLVFGFMENERDKYRYQSARFHFVGWDELTQFTESQYTYLFSRQRREMGLSATEIPLRTRAASNPGNIGHEWVKSRFISPGRPDRIFISSRVQDNPSLDIDEYVATLSEMLPLDRAQLLEGDWTARPVGRKFKREWFPIIEPEDKPTARFNVRYWDLASTEPKPGEDPDWTSGTKLSFCPDGRWLWVVEDVTTTKDTPAEVEYLISRTASFDGRNVPVRMEQEPGASGVGVIDNYSRKVLPAFDFDGIRSTGNKEVRANAVSAAAQRGKIAVVRGAWNEAFFDQLETFPQKGFHDDSVDSFSGAYTFLAAMVEIEFGSVMQFEVDQFRSKDERSPKNLKEYRERMERKRGGYQVPVTRV